MVGSLEIGMVILNLTHKNIDTQIYCLGGRSYLNREDCNRSRGMAESEASRLIANLPLIEDEECRLSV